MKTWYYYLHSNGELIGKNPAVVDSDPDYFDSPFVRKYWLVNLENREDAWRFILEALAMGANINRAKELSEKWGLTFKDSMEMILRIKPESDLKRGFEIFVNRILNMSWAEYQIKVFEIKEEKR